MDRLLAVLSTLYLGYCTLSSVLMCAVNLVLFVVTYPFDRTGKLINLATSLWIYHFVLINPWWHSRYLGRQNIKFGKPYIIVSTHQSAADIFVLYGLLRPFKWVSKESVFKFPVIGWNMLVNRYISLKRGDRASTKGMFEACRTALTRGDSIIMFPEGTRSADGEILEFKRGPFRLACEMNVPVVPVVVDGTRSILPKGQRRVNFKSNIRVRVLPAVEPASCFGDSRILCDRIYALMKDELADMRSELKEELQGDPAGSVRELVSTR